MSSRCVSLESIPPASSEVDIGADVGANVDAEVVLGLPVNGVDECLDWH
jgi:hypothetical protein